MEQDFTILSGPWEEEIIARGRVIHELARLRRHYGGRNSRKLKGIARIQLGDGTIHLAEVHWYRCHGVGNKEFKIKRKLAEEKQ